MKILFSSPYQQPSLYQAHFIYCSLPYPFLILKLLRVQIGLILSKDYAQSMQNKTYTAHLGYNRKGPQPILSSLSVLAYPSPATQRLFAGPRMLQALPTQGLLASFSVFSSLHILLLLILISGLSSRVIFSMSPSSPPYSHYSFFRILFVSFKHQVTYYTY